MPQLLHALDGCRSEPALVWESLRPATKGLETASHYATLLARATQCSSRHARTSEATTIIRQLLTSAGKAPECWSVAR